MRDYLRAKGYDSNLIKDLPEIPMMTNMKKVSLWTSASRFSVMVDRVPTGHIAEYGALKQQGSILAVLRTKDSGSTYMFGPEDSVDINHIKFFEFEQTPLNVLNDAIQWAESFVEEQTEANDKAYPWREGSQS